MKRLRFTLALAGLAALTLTSPGHTQELVTNGGFETGDLTGWTSAPGRHYLVTSDPAYAHTGTYGLQYFEIGSDDLLTQTLATVPGDTETISFWNLPVGGTPNEVQLSLGGDTLLTLDNLPGTDVWTQYSVTTTASSSSELLSFGLREDPAYSGIDDISVLQSSPAATPEPGTVGILAAFVVPTTGLLLRRRRLNFFR